MPINAHPEFLAAETEYHSAQTPEEKIEKLRKMISLAPSHKGAENLRAQLKTRLKKLLEKQESQKKSSKGRKQGIKKEDMQAVLVGFTNTGKSSLLSALTNAKPEIAPVPLTTKFPVIGMIPFQGTNIQLIEIPAFESEYYNKGIVHTADVILILVNSIEQIEKILPELNQVSTKKIIVFNIKNTTDNRKLEATLKSKKYDFIIINTQTNKNENLEQLKEKLFNSFNKLRVFTKEPGKPFKEPKTQKPIVLDAGSTVRDVAEKILHGFSSQVREAFVTGPSSKFPNQKVSLKHVLKDLDVVEFKTR